MGAGKGELAATVLRKLHKKFGFPPGCNIQSSYVWQPRTSSIEFCFARSRPVSTFQETIAQEENETEIS